MLEAPAPRQSRRPLARLVVVAIASLAIALLSACSTDSTAANPTTLRVGQLGSVELNKALLQASGQDQGMGYKLSWQLFPAGPQLIEASGSLDVGQMPDTPPIFAQVAKARIKVVAAGRSFDPAKESTVKIAVPKGSPITSMSQLKGKKVAIFEGTILQYTVLQALQKAGLSYDDITPVNLDPADAVSAFQSGDVDAIAASTRSLRSFRQPAHA